MTNFPERLAALQPFWGAWRLDSAIGEGSYGKVYRIVRQDELGTSYYSALKWISLPQHQTEVRDRYSEGMDEAAIRDYYNSMVRGLQSEIVLMNRLRGTSHVVGFEDHAYLERKGEIGWDVLIRMELLQSLPDRIIAGMTVRDVVHLGINLCDALILCGKHGIVHRDIKPDNIFYSENGDYKLGDFGVARQMNRAMTNMSRKGTPFFMAPEVYLERPSDLSVDQYSLGLVMHRLLNAQQIPLAPLTDRVLTHPEREQAFQARIKGTPVPPPLQGGTKLGLAVAKACSYQPKKRFSGPEAFRDALRSCLSERGLDEPLQMGFSGQSKSNRSSVSLNGDNQGRNGGRRKPGLKPLVVGLSAALVTLIGIGAFLLLKPPPITPPTAAPTEAVALAGASTESSKDNIGIAQGADAVPTSVTQSTLAPTAAPAPVPTAAPAASPTSAPAAAPTAASTPMAPPTLAPTAVPAAVPTAAPTAVPTSAPTAVPTSAPTDVPTVAPIAELEPAAEATEASSLQTSRPDIAAPVLMRAVVVSFRAFLHEVPEDFGRILGYYDRSEYMQLYDEVRSSSDEVWYKAYTKEGEAGYVPVSSLYLLPSSEGYEEPAGVPAELRTPSSSTVTPLMQSATQTPIPAESLLSLDNEPLELTIREEIGLEDGEPLTLERAAQATSLKIPGEQLKNGDVRFLRHFARLQSLTIEQGGIRDVSPLAGLTNLTYLNLSQNKIIDLQPLEGLQNLLTLLLKNNQITDLTALSGLQSLNQLMLDNNAITDVTPLGLMPSLGSLSMTNNRVGDLAPLSGLENLRTLHVQGNPIRQYSTLKAHPGLSGDTPFHGDYAPSFTQGTSKVSKLTIAPGHNQFMADVSWVSSGQSFFLVSCQIKGKNPIDPQKWDKYSYDNAVSIGPLLPGVTYTFTVEDLSSGSTVNKDYKVPAAERFLETTSKDLDVAFYISSTSKETINYTTSTRARYLKQIAEEVELDRLDDLDYMLTFHERRHFELGHNIVNSEMSEEIQAKRGHVQHTLIFVRLPNGHVYILEDSPGFVEAWEFDGTKNMLRYILDHYGKIPTGTWRAEVYYDMKLAGAARLRVQ